MRFVRRVILFLILSLVLIAGLGYAARTGSHVVAVRGHLQEIEKAARNPLGDLVKPTGLASLQTELSQAEADLVLLRADLDPVLDKLTGLGWLPFVGEDLRAAPVVLDMGLQFVKGGRLAVEAAAPLADLGSAASPANRRSPSSLLETTLPRLVAARPKLIQAAAALDQAAALRTRIQRERLSPLLGGWVDRIDRYLPAARLGVGAAVALPDLLGLDRPKTYLLLAQNNDELRPTGGFISGVGTVTIEHGRLVKLVFEDSYAIDDLSKPHPPPPLPLLRYMNAGIWVLRDANWSPDFPTSAQAIADLYRLDRGLSPDGVIAVDLAALELLVGALEPLTLPRYEETIDQRNVLAKVEAYWASPKGEGQTGDWWRVRKEFMGALLEAMVAKLESGTSLNLPRLAEAARRAAQEKHLLVYVNDPTLAPLLAELGWDGSLTQTDGDYVMVVDSNLGYNKVNRHVAQEITYRALLLPDGRVQGQVTLTYTNKSPVAVDTCIHQAKYEPTYAEMTYGCYWDYVRIYVPGQSAFVSAEGLESLPILEYPEPTKQVFAAFFVLPPGQSRTLAFTYQTPPLSRERGEYRLLIQKQPGTAATPVKVMLATLGGYTAAGLKSAGAARLQGERAETELLLDRDQEVVLTLAPSDWTSVPIWAWGVLMASLLFLASGLVRRLWSKTDSKDGGVH